MPEHQQRQVVRRERGRLVASLVRHMGPHRIDLAEDLVQEAIIAAIEHWPYRGIPDNPAAWLTKTAKNKLIDAVRRRELEADYISNLENQASMDTKRVNANEVALLTPDDPELSLLFLCCHDVLNPQEQISLALKLVGGFTAQDIASLFFEKESATGQRLARAKRKLRQEAASSHVSAEHMRTKVPTILKALYLLFTYAYAPKKGARLIMHDTAYEALRIAETLQNYPITKSTEGAALTALMCFQAARFDARSDGAGNIVLLKNQDRSLWDRDLIGKGLIHLATARQSDVVSRYHIEAGMAAIHSTARTWESTDWNSILSLYQPLEKLRPSPMIQINRALILIQLDDIAGAQKLINEVSSVTEVEATLSYQLVSSELAKKTNNQEAAIRHLEEALKLTLSDPVRDLLMAQTSSFDL